MGIIIIISTESNFGVIILTETNMAIIIFLYYITFCLWSSRRMQYIIGNQLPQLSHIRCKILHYNIGTFLLMGREHA
jgi:hypothetical protein